MICCSNQLQSCDDDSSTSRTLYVIKTLISKRFYDYDRELYNISRHFHSNFDGTAIFKIQISGMNICGCQTPVSSKREIAIECSETSGLAAIIK